MARLKGSRTRTASLLCRVALLSLLMPACSAREQPRSAIIIVVDALRADHLGTYGYQRPTSPHLDEWAREGRVFERAYSASTWTLPSLASLHTGQFPSRHGAGMSGFDVPGSIALNRLSSGVPTLAEAFAARGFTTGAAVNNPLLEPAFGLDRGFQIYDHPPDRGRAERRADEMVDRAVALVDSWRDRSFFLLLHFIDPHMDYDAPAPFGGRFSAAYASRLSRPVGDINGLRQRPSELSDQDREFIKAAYDEEIAFVDEQLGRLRSALATRGILDRSLMLVTADHGEELFDHGGFEHGHAMWEEVLHVPLIIWGPGVQAGREASPVSLADVTPTFLEWLGATPPAPLDGVSLWPNLTTQAAIASRTLLAEGRLYGRAERMMLRWPLKVVVDEELHPRRVTDLSVDPGELRNLLDTVPEAADSLVADLRARLAAISPMATSQEPKGLDPRVLERLRSLGYIK